MPMLLQTSVGRAVAGLGAIMIVAAGMLVGIQATAHALAAPRLDHFLCYSAEVMPHSLVPGFRPPSTVGLVNQFSSFTVLPVAVTMHCNPVQKTANGVIAPITNPNAHLLCWSMTAPRQKTSILWVTNQFGTAELTTYQPNLLCLPTWKSLTGPPNRKPVQPPGLDHFSCYPVTYTGTGRFKPPAVVSLTDQFGSSKSKVGNPVLLCLPTRKTVHGVVTPITNPNAQLLCFAVTFPFKSRSVFDQNQFGTGRVLVQKIGALCLPSKKTNGIPPL